jgi:hypothetical protein
MARAWSVRNAAIYGLVFGVVSVLGKVLTGTNDNPIRLASGALFCGVIFAGFAMGRNRMHGVK